MAVRHRNHQAFAPTKRIQRNQNSITNLEMLDAATNCEDAADALIADEAGQRRPNREYTLNDIQVVHIDWSVFDAD
jgi:hypothetical protein